MALQKDYPWLTPNTPVVVGAPMMRISMAKISVEISAAGGLGFLAAGFDLSGLAKELSEAATLVRESRLLPPNDVLPIGVGFQNWGADLQLAIKALSEHPVAAVWFFGPKKLSDLVNWTRQIRAISNNRTKVWIQVGSVREALEVAKTSRPDVLVIQGADSGGHGLAQRAGIVTLLPEVASKLAKEGVNIPLIAAGGIIEGRGAAAAIALGADGICLGTRLLACSDAVVAPGYQMEILRALDGGASTISTTIYDVVRGIKGWPSEYNGRALANRTYQDFLEGMDDKENKSLYNEAAKKGDAGWGPDGRMTTYAGTGVGLVERVMSARAIVAEVQKDAVEILRKHADRYTSSERSQVKSCRCRL